MILLLTGGLISVLFSCSSASREQSTSSSYYSMEDFDNVKKIDAHVHIRTNDSGFAAQARKDNFRLISIVVEDGPDIDIQQQYAIAQKKSFPDRVAFAATFSLKGFNGDAWIGETIKHLDQSIEEGAIAVKVYKDIGMTLKDKEGKWVMVDDSRFKPIWDFLIKKNILVIGHLGEPKNCWLPVEEMTIRSDKSYYTRHPEYHMFLHPEYPSYEKQIEARDNMLEQNPGLKFIGAHLGSLEWDTDELAKRLDRFPNMAVDMAARVTHLQLQSLHNRKKVQDFFIKYQDRILYGTDRIVDDTKAPEEVEAFVHRAWLSDWQFFCTEDTMRTSSFEGVFQGLRLPETVLDKIYFKNARNWFAKLNW